MDQLRQFKGQNFLGPVQLAALPMRHFLNLFQRQESEHPQTLEHISVIHIPPILIEIKRRRLIGIQPDSVACGFSHLISPGNP